LKIVENFRFNFDLKKLIRLAFEQLSIPDLKADTVDRVYGFIFDRLRVVLKESGIQHSVVNAITMTDQDIHVIYRKTKILDEFLKTNEGEKLLLAQRRIKNIIQSNCETQINDALLFENEEIVLREKIKDLETNIFQTQDFREQLILCANMNEIIMNFFEKILVNADDECLKNNRLNLLTKLNFVFETVIPRGL
jgi:glycyl-tRNA synthetase beta chain